MDEFERLARYTAQQDQMTANIEELAGLLGRFRKDLVGSGFSPEEAFDFAFAYFDAILRGQDDE